MAPIKIKFKFEVGCIAPDAIAAIGVDDDHPLRDAEANFVVSRKVLQDAYLLWCKKIAPQHPELRAILEAAQAPGRRLYAYWTCGECRSKRLTAQEQISEQLGLFVEIPNAGTRRTDGSLHIGYNPTHREWSIFPLPAGVGEAEVVRQFMECPQGAVCLTKPNWGKEIEQAVVDYVGDKVPGKLLLDKKGNIVRGESGGRIIFNSPEHAIQWLDLDEEESLHVQVRMQSRKILERVRDLPGAANW